METGHDKSNKEVYELIARFKESVEELLTLSNRRNVSTPIVDYLIHDFQKYADYLNGITDIPFHVAYFYSMCMRNILYLQNDIVPQLPRAIGNIRPKQKQTIVDFGCGNALWSYYMAQYFRSIDTETHSILIDRSHMLEVMDQPVPSRYKCIAEHITFQKLQQYWKNSAKTIGIGGIKDANIIILSEVLHGKSVPTGVELLEDIRKIMKIDGILVVIETRLNPEKYMPMADHMNIQMKVHRGITVEAGEGIVKHMLHAAQLRIISGCILPTHYILAAKRITWPESLTDH